MFREEIAPAEWMAEWADHFRQRASPTAPVDADGMLRIPWPVNAHDGSPADVDVILGAAAAAVATPPSAVEIADAWAGQHAGHERYFFENVRHGIRTPDDRAIWHRIEERAPPWLGAERHREAIELLRAEARQSA
jgi:hypothetical protein